MSRPLRVEYPGAIYHVMCRGNARQRIFHDEADHQRLIDGLALTVSRFGWELFFRPLRDGRVTPRAAHDGATHQCEDGTQGMSSAVPTARIGNGGKKGKKTPGGVCVHAVTHGGVRRPAPSADTHGGVRRPAPQRTSVCAPCDNSL